MNLIVIHKSKIFSPNNGSDLLRFAVCSEPLASITISCLSSNSYPRSNNNVIAIPRDWASQTKTQNVQGSVWDGAGFEKSQKMALEPMTKAKSDIVYYKENLPVPLPARSWLKANSWFVISNGRFVTGVDWRQLSKILANGAALLQEGRQTESYFDADLIAVNVDPTFLSYREKVRITSHGKVAGFRRLYCDSVLPGPIPTDWPHYIFLKPGVLGRVLVDGALPLTFAEFVSRCRSNLLNWRSLKVAGSVLDLGTEAGLLSLIANKLHSAGRHLRCSHRHNYDRKSRADNCIISANTRLFGKVILGQNVRISKGAIVVGPTILSDNVKVGQGTVIRASIIGPGISIPKDYLMQSRVLVGPESERRLSSRHSEVRVRQLNTKGSPFVENGSTNNNFRIWPRLSYARCVKRIADMIVSLAVLILFAPVFPVIALAIRLFSSGPVFFKDRRQGLHGKEFRCLKFRTMILGADKIQDRLRVVNQMDGPQFKIENDPRLSAFGRFLRDTNIDEIPQFVNVLLGQMSVVGPRPSPDSENTLCPSWRDARLSVRPGITGLWQICRTRRPGRDFQEWIYYDTKYVRSLSLRLDLLICWQTAKKLIANFIDQF